MKHAKFQITFSEVEKVNPLFSKCKIYVLYPDLNRNGSSISKEAIEDAIPSIFNTPIVGEYIKDTDNFGSHGGRIEITDNEIKFVDTTKPYGVVPESAKIYWEDVTEENGDVNEYLVVEDAYLWTGRYEDVNTLLENSFGQSMEIEILDSEWTKQGNSKVFNIKKFIFSALCILGIAKEDDEDGHVEPCFESASITAYSLDKDEFKKQFNQMIKELKYSLEKEETTNSTDTNIMSEFDIEGGSKMTDKKEESKKEEFALSSEQVESELRRELAKSQTVDDWGYAYQDYYLVDFLPDANIAIAYDMDEGYLVGVNYMVNGDVVTVDFESAVRYKVNYVPMDAPIEDDDNFSLIHKDVVDYKLNVKEKEVESKVASEFIAKLETYESDLSTLKEEFEVVKQEKEDLETFKLEKIQAEKEEQINEVFEKFSDELTEEELSPIKEKAFELTLEELEDKLFALAGRKKVKFSANKKKERIDMGLINYEKPQEKVVNDIWAEAKLQFSQNK